MYARSRSRHLLDRFTRQTPCGFSTVIGTGRYQHRTWTLVVTKVTCPTCLQYARDKREGW